MDELKFLDYVVLFRLSIKPTISQKYYKKNFVRLKRLKISNCITNLSVQQFALTLKGKTVLKDASLIGLGALITFALSVIALL